MNPVELLIYAAAYDLLGRTTYQYVGVHVIVAALEVVRERE